MSAPPPRQTSSREAFFNRLRAVMFAAHEQLGIDEEANIKGLIGTPGPPRSQPGTPPHIDTGQLQEGVGHHTEGFDNRVVTTLYSDRAPGETDTDVPKALEFGTPTVAPRPYMRTSLSSVRRNALPDIVKAIRNVRV